MSFRDDFSTDHLNDPSWYQESSNFPKDQLQVVNGRCRLRADRGTQLALGASQPLSGSLVTAGFDFQGVAAADSSLVAGVILQSGPIDSVSNSVTLFGYVAFPQNLILVNGNIENNIFNGYGNVPAGRDSGYVELQYDRTAKLLIARFRDVEGGAVVGSATLSLTTAPDTPLYAAIVVAQTPAAAVSVDDFSASGGTAAAPPPPPPPVTVGAQRSGSGFRFLD